MAKVVNTEIFVDPNNVQTLILTSQELLRLHKDNQNINRLANESYLEGNYESSIFYYTEAINNLERYGLPPNATYLLNRSASYTAQKQYIRALHDANRAIDINPEDWRGYWRKGLVLMAMEPRVFRIIEALKSFKTALTCPNLPSEKIKVLEKEIESARTILKQKNAADI